MNADGTGTRTQTFVVAVQSDAALREVSVLSIVFPSKSEHADFVYLRVVHPDGSTQSTPIADAIEQPAPVTRAAPLYSDLETKQLPVKSLRIGDTIEWQTRATIFHAEVAGQFWGQDTFTSGAVVLDESDELRVPTGLHLTVWTNPRAGASVSESDAGAQHIYRWRHADLHPTVGTQAEAAKKAEETRLRTPEEEIDATKGALPSFAWTTFPDWAAVGAWYRDLVADRITPDAAITAKVAELTSGKKADLEKAQAVFNFVSSGIRYIGVDFGVGRYQPHTASEVFANQYGDCKDKHVLLASMLSVLKLRADPILVGAGVRFNSAVPSPASFNHLITRVSLDGKDVWLDSTPEIGIWGALIKTIRDQDALVIPQSSPAVVAHTAADLPFQQSSIASVVGSLDKDLTSESKITFTFHDDTELYLRASLRNVSPANYGVFVQAMMGGMGFGGTTSDPVIEHLDDPSQPLLLSFHYRRLKEKDWGDNRITAIFQPVSVPGFTADNPPTSAIQLGSLRTESSRVEMQLPEGWRSELPEAVHARAPFATCDVTYSLKDHKLVAERRFTVLQSKVPVKDFKQYQSWYDESGVSGVPYIQLLPPPKVTTAATLPQPKAPDLPAGAPKPSDPHAAELIRKAFLSMRPGDLDTARTLLDQAAAINPTEAYLWSDYGIIAELLGMKNQMLEDLQREVTYHPQEVQMYAPLANAQLQNSDTKASIATLHAWVKAAPDSRDAALALAGQLQRLKFPAEALQEAEAELIRLKASNADLTYLHIVAANAQVDLGHANEAADNVAPLLQTITDTSQINDIAYILAEAGTHLPEASAAQAKILVTSEAATAAWKISDDLQPMMPRQIGLAAQWDTMAWILFRQGKFAEALPYADAARRTNGNKDDRDHFAAIASALHNPIASATVHDDDQKLRTFPLGPSKGRHGVASFMLLLDGGKVLDTTPEISSTSSTPTLPDATLLLKAVDLHTLFPPGSKVHLMRNGMVNCHSTTCELVLAPIILTGYTVPDANRSAIGVSSPSTSRNLPN